jgi:asparagine N-glycosylation enzyme membrane subunit Stt3
MDDNDSTSSGTSTVRSLFAAPLAGAVLLLLTMTMYPLGVTYDSQTAVMTQVLPFVLLTIGALLGVTPRIIFSGLGVKPSRVTLFIFTPLVLAAAIPQLVIGDTLLGLLFVVLALGVHLFDRAGRSEEANILTWTVMGFYAALSFAAVAAPTFDGSQWVGGAWLPGLDVADGSYWGHLDLHREAVGFLFFNAWMVSMLAGALATFALRGRLLPAGRGGWFVNLPERLNLRSTWPLYAGFALWMLAHIAVLGSFFSSDEGARLAGDHMSIWWALFTGVLSLLAMFFISERWKTRATILLANWLLFSLSGLQEKGLILTGSADWHSYFQGSNGLFVWFFIFFWMNSVAIILGVMGKLGDTSPRRSPGPARLWWSAHWYGITLTSAMLVALIIRTVWSVTPAMNASGTHEWDLTGGSDPWYMMRAVEYILAQHSHFLIDMDRSYPLGAINPRPPLFVWSMAVGGMLLAPILGVPAEEAVWWSVAALPVIYGTLTVLPMASIGRRFFSKGTGAVVAWLIALMPGHVSKSTFAMADHDAFVILFLTLGFYFWLKAVEAAGSDKLVTRASWRPSYFLKGIKATFEQRPTAISNAILAGFAFATVALGWKGFVYGLAILYAAFFLQVLLNMFRRRDSMPLTVAALAMMVSAFLLPLPFYAHMELELLWDASGFQPMFYILAFTFVTGYIASASRDLPWLVIAGPAIIGMLIIAGGVNFSIEWYFGVLAVSLLFIWMFLVSSESKINPQYLVFTLGAIGAAGWFIVDVLQDTSAWEVLFTGGYYFSKNKIFGTIAEAQAPSRGMLFGSFGPLVALLAIGAGITALWQGVRKQDRVKLVLAVWMLVAGFMAWRAGRFVFNATPPVAVMGAWSITLLWGLSGGGKIAKSWRRFGIGTPKARFTSGTKALKKHPAVGAILLVFMLLASQHATYGMDAGIPQGNSAAKDIDSSIYNITPRLLRTADPIFGFSVFDDTPYNPSSGCRGSGKSTSCWYMGSFGSGFNGRYWNNGYQWLEEQDQELTFGQRPAFVSWWDYGFQALAQGKHPTVADNFQSGIPNSGNMLLAQSEEDLLALWILTLAEGDLRYSGDGGFTPGFERALKRALSDVQYDEFVLLETLSGDEQSVVVDHSFTVTHTAGSTALAEGYRLNDIGIPVTTKSYRIYDSREWDGTEHTSLFDAMASLNSTKHRNDEVTEDITHYIIGGYWYTVDLVEDFADSTTSLHRQNARLALGRTLLSTALTLDELVTLNHEVSNDIIYTVADSSGKPGAMIDRNHEIRYFAVDNRLYPVAGAYSASGGNPTGIFYAPTTLSGLDPDTYFQTSYITQRGASGYPVDMSSEQYEAEYKDDIVRSQSQNDLQVIQLLDIRVDHEPEFFDTMVARTYIGYGSPQLGLDVALNTDPVQPGQHFDMRGSVNSSLQYAFPLPAAMMNHFVIANWYDGDNADGTRQWYDANTAVKILKYYSGATLSGEVQLGDISTVPNARILIERDAYSGESSSDGDPREYWIPIGTVDADADGHFEFRVPAGHIRATAFTGFTGVEAEARQVSIDKITQAQNNFQTWQSWLTDVLGDQMGGPRELNPVTALLANVSGGKWIGEMEFNVTGEQADSNGEQVLEHTLLIEASSASGTVAWDGHFSFDGEPLISHELILSEIWTRQELPHIWTTNGTVESDAEHPRTFRGTGEVTFTGDGLMQSEGSVLVSDFTGNFTRQILHNHSFTGSGQFKGAGTFEGTLDNPPSNISNCVNETVPVDDEICLILGSDPAAYVFINQLDGTGRVTANGTLDFTAQMYRETFVGAGIFTTNTSDDQLETYGVINGTGLFSGDGIFSGDMVEAGSFHLVDALPGTYQVEVILGNGKRTRLSTPLEVEIEPTADVELLMPGSYISGDLKWMNGSMVSGAQLEIIDDSQPDSPAIESCEDTFFAPCIISADENGSFGFGPLPEGNYSLSMDFDGDGFHECVPWNGTGYGVCNGVAHITAFGEDAQEYSLISINNPVPVHYDVEFTVWTDLGGGTVEPVSDVDIWFHSELLLDDEYLQARYDNNTSSYHMELPVGAWVVNGTGEAGLMLWEEFEVIEDLSGLEWTLARSVEVNGTILVYTQKEDDPTDPAHNLVVEFQWGGIETSVTTDMDGNFSLQLPEHAIVNMTAQSIASQLSNGTQFEVLEGMDPIVLFLENGLSISGSMFINRNTTLYTGTFPGYQPAEIHAYDHTRDVHWFLEIGADGRFSNKLQEGVWTLSMDDDWFNLEPSDINVSLNNSENLLNIVLMAQPDNITIDITAFIDHEGDANVSNGTLIDIDLAFVPISSGGLGIALNVTAAEFTDGRITVDVEPGIYTLAVEPQNVTDVSAYDYDTQLATAENIVLELGLNNVSEAVEIPFLPMWRVNAELTNFSGGAVAARQVNFESVDGETQFDRFTDENGTLLYYLPEGEWIVTVDRFNVGVTHEEFRGLLTIDGNASLDGITWRTKESAHLLITFYEEGSGDNMSGFELIAHSEDGLGNLTLPATNSDGVLDAYIWPGTWSLSLNSTFSQERWLLDSQTLDELSDGEQTPDNTSMILEHWVTLGGNLFWDLDDDGEYDEGEGVEGANISVSGGGLPEVVNLTSSEFGTWQLFVPVLANYTIEATRLGFAPVNTTIVIAETSNSTDLELLAGNVTVTGLIDYVQMEVWDEISAGVVLQLVPHTGIERESHTPVKLLDNEGYWNGSWSADIEPGEWVLIATNEAAGVVGVELVDASVHDGAEVNLTLVPGGILHISTSWIDFEGDSHHLGDSDVPGAEMIDTPSIDLSMGGNREWVIGVDSDGNVDLLLPEGTLFLESEFQTFEHGLNMTYSAGLSIEVAAEQETPVNTLRFNRQLDHGVQFNVTEVTGATPHEELNNDVDVLDSSESGVFETIEFTIEVDYTGNEALDEYDVTTIFSAEDIEHWSVEFHNGTDANGTVQWVEEMTIQLGLNIGGTLDLSMRVKPANLSDSISLDAGHKISLRLTHTDGSYSGHQLTVRIPQTYQVNVLEQPEGTTGVFPGEEKRVEFMIENAGNGHDTIQFEIDTTWLPEGWSATGPQESPYGSGEARTYSFTVFAPADAGGDSFTLHLNISSEDNTSYPQVTIVVQAARPLLTFEDIDTFSGSDAITGSRNQFVVRVSNTGLVDAQEVSIRLDMPEYPELFTESDPLTVPAGEIVDYMLFLDLEGVGIGKQKFNFTIIVSELDDLDASSVTNEMETIHVSTAPAESVNTWVPMIIVAMFIIGLLLFRRVRAGMTGAAPF